MPWIEKLRGTVGGVSMSWAQLSKQHFHFSQSDSHPNTLFDFLPAPQTDVIYAAMKTKKKNTTVA